MRLHQRSEPLTAYAVCRKADCEWQHDYKRMAYATCRKHARAHVKAHGHSVSIYVEYRKTLYPKN